MTREQGMKLRKENEELKSQIQEQQLIAMQRIADKELKIVNLEIQIEEMKKSCLDVMRVQGSNLTDDYMAGMYNGMVVVYNSCFLEDDELEINYCSKNEHNKWETPE